MINSDNKDRLDNELDDSFPASDPPSMVSGSTATPTSPHTTQADTQGSRRAALFRVIESPDSDRPFAAQPTYKAGRWTSDGTPAIYASATEAGAILEYLAHARPGSNNEVLLASATIPSDCILTQQALPSTWSDLPHSGETQCIGDQWQREHASLALKVPSALAPGQHNYLINPAHVDHVHLQSVVICAVRIDPRLKP